MAILQIATCALAGIAAVGTVINTIGSSQNYDEICDLSTSLDKTRSDLMEEIDSVNEVTGDQFRNLQQFINTKTTIIFDKVNEAVVSTTDTVYKFSYSKPEFKELVRQALAEERAEEAKRKETVTKANAKAAEEAADKEQELNDDTSSKKKKK